MLMFVGEASEILLSVQRALLARKEKKKTESRHVWRVVLNYFILPFPNTPYYICYRTIFVTQTPWETMPHRTIQSWNNGRKGMGNVKVVTEDGTHVLKTDTNRTLRDQSAEFLAAKTLMLTLYHSDTRPEAINCLIKGLI